LAALFAKEVVVVVKVLFTCALGWALEAAGVTKKSPVNTLKVASARGSDLFTFTEFPFR
jgi:predicted Zn-dependent protease